MSREQILDQINQAPAERRAELYQQYSDIYHRPPPAPSREQVAASQDAHDAERRLAALTSNVDWIRKFTAGSPAERAEYEELKAIIAAGADETGMSIRVGDAEIVDAVTDPHGIRRHELFGALSDMNKRGIPIGALERFMDGNWSDADYEFATRELDRLTATPAWRDALSAGDPTALHEFEAWSMIVSSRKVL
jgi:hypothetical protein